MSVPPTTFSSYFCRSVKEHPQATVVYLVAITALIATLGALNWGEGVNVIVGSAVAGAHVVPLAIAYAYFSTHMKLLTPLTLHGHYFTHLYNKYSAENRSGMALEDLFTEVVREIQNPSVVLSTMYSDKSAKSILQDHYDESVQAIFKCRYTGLDAFLMPIILLKERSAPINCYFLFIESSSRLHVTLELVALEPGEKVGCIDEYQTFLDPGNDLKSFLKSILDGSNRDYRPAFSLLDSASHTPEAIEHQHSARQPTENACKAKTRFGKRDRSRHTQHEGNQTPE